MSDSKVPRPLASSRYPPVCSSSGPAHQRNEASSAGSLPTYASFSSFGTRKGTPGFEPPARLGSSSRHLPGPAFRCGTHLAVSQLDIRKLEHHAAHVGVGEEVVSRELEVVQGTARVVEEGVTTPASEEAVLARLRHRSFRAARYRSTLDDRASPPPSPSPAPSALDAADRRSAPRSLTARIGTDR